jgi:HEAT repeat protein
MLDLMKDDRTSSRIQATTVTLSLLVADPTVINNLAYLLQNDENPNVRLAALDALRRFADDPQVREEFLLALEGNPPEVLRFELIEILVHLEEKRVLPILEKMIDADSLPQPVRDAAQMASFKLI